MRWRILALLFLARVSLGFQFQTLASVGEDLVFSFQLNYSDLGLLIGLFMAPGLVLALPAGFAGQLLSDRWLSVLGLIALALGGLVSGFAQDGWTVGLGRVLAGCGFLFSTLYFTKMVADWFEGREIATAMSIFVMSWPFGIAMGQVAHAALAQAFDWRVPFFVASGCCAASAVAVLLLYRAPNTAHTKASGATWRLAPREWRLVVCAGFAWGVFNAGYVTYLTYGPQMLVFLGEATLKAAAIISIGSWLLVFSGAICGMIVDRFGRRDVVLMACIAAALLSLALLGQPGLGLWGSVLFGLMGVAPAGVIMALAGEAVAPERRAFGMGVFFSLYYALMTAAPPVAGAILDATGQPFAPLIFGMALFALVLFATFGFRVIQRRPAPANPANP